MTRKPTEVQVYWDAQDPQNNSWAYRASDADGLIESGGLTAESNDLYRAVEEAICAVGLDLTADNFAIEPHIDGGYAIWTEARYEIRVDLENNAEVWWDELTEALPELAEQLREAGGATVDVLTLATLQSLPGWSGGPAYARNSLIVTEV